MKTDMESGRSREGKEQRRGGGKEGYSEEEQQNRAESPANWKDVWGSLNCKPSWTTTKMAGPR